MSAPGPLSRRWGLSVPRAAKPADDVDAGLCDTHQQPQKQQRLMDDKKRIPEHSLNDGEAGARRQVCAGCTF